MNISFFSCLMLIILFNIPFKWPHCSDGAMSKHLIPWRKIPYVADICDGLVGIQGKIYGNCLSSVMCDTLCPKVADFEVELTSTKFDNCCSQCVFFVIAFYIQPLYTWGYFFLTVVE